MGKTSHHLLELNANLSKTIGERAKLLLITNRKSHALSIDTKTDDLGTAIARILSDFTAFRRFRSQQQLKQ